MDNEQVKKVWDQYSGRIIGAVLGFIFALLWMSIGFAETLLIFVVMGAAYCVGAYFDGELDLNAWLKFFNIKWYQFHF